MLKELEALILPLSVVREPFYASISIVIPYFIVTHLIICVFILRDHNAIPCGDCCVIVQELTSAESKATYRQIKDWVKENYGIKT